jgi:hypothetical protein
MAMTEKSRVARPALGWFALLDGGIVALALLSFSSRAHAAVSEAAPVTLPGRPKLQALLVATGIIHLAEAVVAARGARRRGLPARGWAVQTFVVGFPSLRALGRTPAL